MPLPKKINPERIREAIVQVYFHAETPFEPLIGYIYSALSEFGYSYTNRPVTPKHFIQSGTQAIPNSFDIVVAPQYFFFNDHIRVQVQENGSLTFNSMNNYPGWPTYSTHIKQVLGLLLEKKTVINFRRVGIRYISEFPNVDILKHVKLKVELEGLDVPMKSGNFRVEWVKDSFRFIVNLASKLPIPPLVVEINEKHLFTSLVDIDVICQNFEVAQPEKLFELIEQVHFHEKEQFYQLLKPEFLESLNPEY